MLAKIEQLANKVNAVALDVEAAAMAARDADGLGKKAADGAAFHKHGQALMFIIRAKESLGYLLDEESASPAWEIRANEALGSLRLASEWALKNRLPEADLAMPATILEDIVSQLETLWALWPKLLAETGGYVKPEWHGTWGKAKAKWERFHTAAYKLWSPQGAQKHLERRIGHLELVLLRCNALRAYLENDAIRTMIFENGGEEVPALLAPEAALARSAAMAQSLPLAPAQNAPEDACAKTLKTMETTRRIIKFILTELHVVEKPLPKTEEVPAVKPDDKPVNGRYRVTTSNLASEIAKNRHKTTKHEAA